LTNHGAFAPFAKVPKKLCSDRQPPLTLFISAVAIFARISPFFEQGAYGVLSVIGPPTFPYNERKQVIWLFFSFLVIGLMAVAVMLYGAVMSGWRPRRP
jgi:hypothetical protein